MAEEESLYYLEWTLNDVQHKSPVMDGALDQRVPQKS